MRRRIDREVTLKEIADSLGDLATAIIGDPETNIADFSTLDEATDTDLTFLTSSKYAEDADQSVARACLVLGDLRVENRPCISVTDMWKSILIVLDLLYPDDPPPTDIHPSAVVDASAKIGQGVSVGPLAVIEANAIIGDNVRIGAHCTIGRDAAIGDDSALDPGVRVLDRVTVGRRTLIQAGAVLGADGHRFEVIDGLPRRIPQVGTVVVEDDVVIGANSCIDRAFLGETRIGQGCMIDNQVHIAHNCKIGPYNFFAAQCGISGSVRTGVGCIFWGKAGVRDQVTIGDGVEVMARSGVKDDLPDGGKVFGFPAIPLNETGRIEASQKRLPDLLKRVRSLEKKLK